MIKRYVFCLTFAAALIIGAAAPFTAVLPAQAAIAATVPTFQAPGNITINPDIKLLLPPAAPSNLAAAVSGSAINLTWTDNSGNETGFRIERKTGSSSYSEVATVGANISAYSDTGLQPGTTYFYRIRSYNAPGDSGYSNEAGAAIIVKASGDILIPPGGIKLPKAPAAPSDLTETFVNDVPNLTWKDNAGNETGFKIERKTEGGVYAEIATVGANTTTYADSSGLSPNIRYYYRVMAYNAYGESNYSNEINFEIKVSQYIGVIIKYYIGQSDYYVNGMKKTMDTAPFIKDDRVFLPIRYVVEPLGAALYWNETEQKVTVKMDGKTIELWIDQNIARINGVDTPIDPVNPNITPFVVPPGRIFVPVRFIAVSLGCQVDWDQALQEVKVSYPKP